MAQGYLTTYIKPGRDKFAAFVWLPLSLQSLEQGREDVEWRAPLVLWRSWVCICVVVGCRHRWRAGRR